MEKILLQYPRLCSQYSVKYPYSLKSIEIHDHRAVVDHTKQGWEPLNMKDKKRKR